MKELLKKMGFRRPKTRLLRSLSYAFEGIYKCAKQERNFRIHIFIAVGVLLLSKQFHLSQAENIAIVISVFLVLSAETFNTAIENLVNLVTDRHHKIAKVVKDLSSGAVLLTGFSAIALFCMIFLTRPDFFGQAKNALTLYNILIMIPPTIILFLPVEKKFKK